MNNHLIRRSIDKKVLDKVVCGQEGWLPLTLMVSLSANPVLLNTLNSTTVRDEKLSIAPAYVHTYIRTYVKDNSECVNENECGTMHRRVSERDEKKRKRDLTFSDSYWLITIVPTFSRHMLKGTVTNDIVTRNSFISLYFDQIARITADRFVLKVTSFDGIVLTTSSYVDIFEGRTTVKIEI